MCICKLLSLWIPCRIAPSPWLTWGFAALDQLGMNIASCWSKSFAATWGVPELGDPHSWMVKKRKFLSKRDDELGYPHFRKAPLDSFLLVSYCSCVCRRRQCHVWWSNPELDDNAHQLGILGHGVIGAWWWFAGIKMELSPYCALKLCFWLFTKNLPCLKSSAIWSTIQKSIVIWFTIINCTAIWQIYIYIVIWKSSGPFPQWSTHQPSFGSSIGELRGARLDGLRGPVISGIYM